MTKSLLCAASVQLSEYQRRLSWLAQLSLQRKSADPLQGVIGVGEGEGRCAWLFHVFDDWSWLLLYGPVSVMLIIEVLT